MIEGNNIRLRALTRKDFAKTYKWHNDLELKNLTLSHPFPVSDVQEDEWYNGILKDRSNRNVYFGIEEKSNKKLIGIIFLSKINMIHQTCWLGIFIGDKNTRGKGFGKEAVKMICDYAFGILNLRKISLEVIKSNKSAIELYKKVGFSVEGVMIKQVWNKAKFQDLAVMSYLK